MQFIFLIAITFVTFIVVTTTFSELCNAWHNTPRKAVTVALISCTALAIPIKPVQAIDFSDIYNIRGFVQSTSAEIERSSDLETFKQVDKLLKQYNVNYRLQVVLNDTPEQYIRCARTRANAFKDDIYTIVEYFSVSNAERSRMFISDAYPGQKKTFIKQGLDAAISELNNLILCYPQY
jgi:hypothetical protein